MPYISKERRKALWNDSHTDYNSTIMTKGELNYMISCLLIDYIDHHGLSYQVISEAGDAARNAANELDRRLLSKYEDQCIKKNGDIYQDLIKKINTGKNK